MRKTFIVAGTLVILWIVWLVWPVTALFDLVRAVEARDVAAIADQIDVRSVRRSLTGQLLNAYYRVTGKRPDSTAVTTLAVTIADPLVGRLVTPGALADLLHSGWVAADAAGIPIDARGLSAKTLGNAWQIFLNSRRGFDRFSISFPADKPMPHRFRLEWTLSALSWRLTEVSLPEPLADRLARELVPEPRRGS